MKAYTTADGRIVCFRPDLNAQRMAESCRRMRMPVYPEDQFVEAVMEVVRANAHWVPPYGSGASLYIRPYMFGINPVIGVKPADEYQLRIFATPVGPYFKGGIKPLKLRISDFDRAAPRGTGHIKAGLNYAMSLYAIMDAHEQGYDENVYLDSGSRTYIEETGGANIVFIKGNTLVTPKSDTILPSITRRSLVQVAKEYLGMEVEERPVALSEIGEFSECGLCGTAAVISPVGEIHDHGTVYSYAGMGPKIQALYDTLRGIQMGTVEGPEGWLREV
jgi:branched-chain amino acid aminotransferase